VGRSIIYNIVCAGSSTHVHKSFTNTHQHLPMYHTVRLGVMSKDHVNTQNGEVYGCVGQVRSQRGCSTYYPCIVVAPKSGDSRLHKQALFCV